MKQTAVDWLKVTVKAMIENGGDADLHAVLWHIEQAKEMEKEQIKDAYKQGTCHHGDGYTATEYYNETFNTNEK
jgi:hypothetical protein